MSRRGVAAMVGKSHTTLGGWVERGMAYPDEEPWGSFSVQYRRAERGLELAAAGTVGMTAQMLYALTKKALGGNESAIEALSKQGPQLKELLNVLASRYPEDWGQSKHRVPEPEFSAQNYLDSAGMEREQLAALFADPPESIRNALVDAAESVYGILLAGGFVPATKGER
jgi:hypothetical protein